MYAKFNVFDLISSMDRNKYFGRMDHALLVLGGKHGISELSCVRYGTTSYL